MSEWAWSPDGLSSRSLGDFGAEVEHQDVQDLRYLALLFDGHRSPQQLEADDHSHVLKPTGEFTGGVRIKGTAVFTE